MSIDTSKMDADESIAYHMAKSLWPDDEASFEREWLRCRQRRERQALREKQRSDKRKSKT